MKLCLDKKKHKQNTITTLWCRHVDINDREQRRTLKRDEHGAEHTLHTCDAHIPDTPY